MNIIEMIEKYNLSIRRIPNKVTGCYELKHFKKGDEIIEGIFRNGNTRKFAKRTKIPGHAGKYMVKQINNTMSMIQWNIKEDNLADTLECSIELFLSKLK